jgi:hypothetical protein
MTRRYKRPIERRQHLFGTAGGIAPDRGKRVGDIEYG